MTRPAWLMIQVDLADLPEVQSIAYRLKIDADTVVGKLFRVWAWATAHTTSGHVSFVNTHMIDAVAGCPGFGVAMVDVSWLADEDDGVRFYRWDDWLSPSAKARAGHSLDVAMRRGNQAGASSRPPVVSDHSVQGGEPPREQIENNRPQAPPGEPGTDSCAHNGAHSRVHTVAHNGAHLAHARQQRANTLLDASKASEDSGTPQRGGLPAPSMSREEICSLLLAVPGMPPNAVNS
ncbi:MAG: hypothetical protein L6Q35_03975 [Phycisphaerales bacterium]|nr:hypothetical protein [Phycisphaerales bacterium]